VCCWIFGGCSTEGHVLGQRVMFPNYIYYFIFEWRGGRRGKKEIVIRNDMITIKRGKERCEIVSIDK
jgi:hypothetical protein